MFCINFWFWVGFFNLDEFDLVFNKFKDFIGLFNCCGVIGCMRFKIIISNNLDGLLDLICKEESIFV